MQKLDLLFAGDVVTRTFTKQRGEATVYYVMKTRNTYLNIGLENTNLELLRLYLSKVFLDDLKFYELGCSDCQELIGSELDLEFDGSEVVNICREAGLGSLSHQAVQDYFIYNDPYTIVTELPVYSKALKRSGFIDIVRKKDNKIWLLDYKPHANKERYQKVFSQLRWYKELFCECTGISKSHVKLGYFDNMNFYKLK